MPSIHELGVKTGRKESGVLVALAGLKEQGYIEWDPEQPERIVVLKQWEEPKVNYDWLTW